MHGEIRNVIKLQIRIKPDFHNDVKSKQIKIFEKIIMKIRPD